MPKKPKSSKKPTKNSNKSPLIILGLVTFLAIFSLVFVFIFSKNSESNIASIYRTEEEWKNRFVVPEYSENKEITGDYDSSLAAKAKNGTFVGKMEDDVRVWKGIAYAKQPVGDLRFRKSESPDPSDRVYEAYSFGKSCMQTLDKNERASQYPQGEDCLNLNIWSSTKSEQKKPVVVYIHGGGWVSGGTTDPLYDGFNFAHYNPDVMLVTFSYRIGLLGLINLTSFPDGEEYPTSAENCLFDQISALKWVKENISAFGGDPDNVTIVGESAGGISVSLLSVMPEAEGLFNKVIPMSGAANLTSTKESTLDMPTALASSFSATTVSDLKSIPVDDLFKWWTDSAGLYAAHPLRDDTVFGEDPLDRWARGDTRDLLVLQGHTSNEFRYYESVFLNVYKIYYGMCEALRDYALKEGNEEFKKAYDSYVESKKSLGESDEDILMDFANDITLAGGNLYQAESHMKNGGKGYFYIFDKSYDGNYAHLGAAHAVDCHYLFGNFDGDAAAGTAEEVELSREFQRMIANFAISGNPATSSHAWPAYRESTRKTMIIGDNIHVESNPEPVRTAALMTMFDTNPSFRHAPRVSSLADQIIEKYPDAAAEFYENFEKMQIELSK